MRHWFKDQHFRSLLKNSSYLASSRAVAAVCSLATLAFAGHGLGLLLFGSLTLITSYAKAASGLTKFQSWQLIVRHSGQALAGEGTEEFKASTGFVFGLDLLSGIGGMILAVLLLPLVGGWFGFGPDQLWLAMLYCALLPTMGAATPVGVLRALDRFDLISWEGALTPVSRAVLAGTAFAFAQPFPVYVLIWFVTDLAGDLVLWWLAWRELGRHGLLRGIRPTLRPAELPGAWRFAIHINLTSTIHTSWGPLARLIVGGLLGPAGAAIFRVGGSLADSAQKPADLLSNAFYPEIARMDLATKKPWKLMVRSAVMAAGFALLFVAILLIAGKPLISLLFGKSFLGAYPVMMVLTLIPLLGIFSFPLTPMLYALDRPDAPLKSRILGTGLFLLAVAPMAWRFGVIGAAIAYVAGYATMVASLIIQLRTEYHRVRKK